MTVSAKTTRRGLRGGLAAFMLGGAAAATIALPSAGAQPAPCNASDFAFTASGVLNTAGGYLNAHPGANDVLTRAAKQPAGEAETSVRSYFEAHPNEYLDLRNIAQPLINQRNQCGFNVSGSQLNLLFNELAS